SAVGSCVILRPEVCLDSELLVLFRYSVTGSLGKGNAPLIAIRGTVIRVETTGLGMHSVAVKIHRSRFL
ncbi:MAG: hypothetical protein HYZ23_08215, partial [Chloroflexi bacterium]|nr:hypothetical protein [Chloroflexota bacterium]